MKKIITAALMAVSFNSMAINMHFGYPVEASRLSLSGEVEFNVDCATQDVEIVKSSNIIFDRHIRKNVKIICYRDTEKHHVRMVYKEGIESRKDLIATQPNRFIKVDNKISYE